jgi:methionyl-tRNA formyltransferase
LGEEERRFKGSAPLSTECGLAYRKGSTEGRLKIEVWGSGEYLRRGMEVIGNLVGTPAELLVCLAHPKILKPQDWEPYKYGAINFHCGLPNYRGRHPLQWMLIDGVSEIPVAVHFIDEGVDTGNVIVESYVPVSRNETYASALDKVTEMVGPMALEAIRRVEAGCKGTKQPEGRSIRKRTPEDSQFSFDMPSSAVHRFINAMADPMPNAFCNAVRYKRSVQGEPGEILARLGGGWEVVATRDGYVLVERA